MADQMDRSLILRIVLAIGLMVNAVAAYFIVRDVFAGTDPETELVSAIALAVIIGALGVAILINPHRYLLIAASGTAVLGIVFIIGFTALLLIFAQGDLYNRNPAQGVPLAAAVAIAFQLLMWSAAWKVQRVPFGDAIALSMVGALAVLVGGTVIGFIAGAVAAFFL
jgi:hypothetical protein